MRPFGERHRYVLLIVLLLQQGCESLLGADRAAGEVGDGNSVPRNGDTGQDASQEYDKRLPALAGFI